MRLLTHNMLSSNIKGVVNGFPLRIEVEKVVEKQVDFNPDFVKNMFSKIEWKPLVDASRTMGYAELPEEAESSMLDSHDFLQRFHHALLELHLEEGALICPGTGRRFPVNKGIPNLLLHEDEFPPIKSRRPHSEDHNSSYHLAPSGCFSISLKMAAGRVAHVTLKGPSVVKEILIGMGVALFAGSFWKMHQWNEQRKVRAFYDLLEKGEIGVVVDEE
ncbi:Multifunctional methyltransferase subunit TRM112-like protein, partial [Cucurbita argyrosperma subsp. argyrosperma]